MIKMSTYIENTDILVVLQNTLDIRVYVLKRWHAFSAGFPAATLSMFSQTSALDLN